MKLFVHRENGRLIAAVAGALLAFAAVCWGQTPPRQFWIAYLLLCAGILTACIRYLIRQNGLIEQAIGQMEAYLDGNRQTRLACDDEGALYRLFHAINTMAAVLDAHAANEQRDKDFLKNTISDISHQLKTPLAALNIYNGLVQSEAEDLPQIRAFADRAEQELDRMETLVKNLLKITRLDAGALAMERTAHNIADMMKDVGLHFAYRAERERKNLTLSGDEPLFFSCDREWLTEAVSNIVKNAFDHTEAGDTIEIEWKKLVSVVEIRVRDTGKGIHREDIHHIFKRFYRSRFSKDTQGIGLGLPLAKAIIDAHDGTIEVDSAPGEGAVFCIRFLIPTEL